MDEAEDEIVAFFFPAAGHAFVVGVELTLRVAETRVDERALGERVFVAEGCQQGEDRIYELELFNRIKSYVK